MSCQPFEPDHWSGWRQFRGYKYLANLLMRDWLILNLASHMHTHTHTEKNPFTQNWWFPSKWADLVNYSIIVAEIPASAHAWSPHHTAGSPAGLLVQRPLMSGCPVHWPGWQTLARWQMPAPHCGVGQIIASWHCENQLMAWSLSITQSL